MSTTIIDSLKRTKMMDLLSTDSRIDGRRFDEFRPISIKPRTIPKANGSATVRIGDTEVVCGVKIQPDRPFPDTGDRGIFICTAELLPLSHPSVETGPPGPDVIELARVVDRGIRESHMLEMGKMVIQENKSVVGVFADNVVVDYDGNLFDACSFAATAALLSSLTPKWEMVDDAPKMVEGPPEPLPINTIPTSVTMGRIGDSIIVDPNADEWACLDARITITTNSDGNICALQKGGHDGLVLDQIKDCGKMSAAIGAKIREQFVAIQKECQQATEEDDSTTKGDD